jgi:glycosyltransferase involved in cell wall biosynthesis/GT2 family glycosyltransferase
MNNAIDQIQWNTSPGPYFEPGACERQAPDVPPVKLIAFYLPQFHPIPENDLWWGKGFTEWTNVTRALPRFRGHVQPRLPGELGFYDLRNVDVLFRQAELARRYGIGGFCFHHYWFGGRRLLHKPLELFLANSDIDLPFCIDWANENWTRRWDGQEHEVLLGQAYSADDDVAFARSLFPIVTDRRYIHIDGRPLLMIYRPGLLPDPVAAARRWRVEFSRAGLPDPFIVMAQGFGAEDPRTMGLDAAVEFPPHKVAVTPPIGHRLDLLDPRLAGHIMDYGEVAKLAASLPRPPYRLFRGVCPSWDNEARRPGRGLTLAFSDPEKYGTWLMKACRAALVEANHPDERIVFINAWNEWAEGAYLEPDRHFGHAYLAQTARVLRQLVDDTLADPRRHPERPKVALLSHDAYLHGAQVVALAVARALVKDHNVSLTVLLGGPGELMPEFERLAPTVLVPGEFRDIEAWRVAAANLAEEGITAIICSTLVSAQAIRPLREAGIRIVMLVHELPSIIRHYSLESAARDAAEQAAAIVFASPYVRDRFVELAGPIHGQVVLRHQAINLRDLDEGERAQARSNSRESWGLSSNRPIVLGVGYGDSRKGIDLWPRLIKRVVEDYPDAQFVWVGRVDDRLLPWVKHDLEAAGIADRLLILPPCRDLSVVYAAADLFVLTSREDPFPSVVLEAMASRLPVIVFEGSGGITDLVRQTGNTCVPYLDVDAMALAISRLLGDPPALKVLGSVARTHVEPNLDYGAYAKLLLDLTGQRKPSITAIVPNYNYARYLPRRLESIWAQTRRVDEIILLDDASSDGSDSVIADLVARSPVPIQVVQNEVNSGSVSRQWAKGVALAKGELVWIAEADDYAEPDFLDATSAAFQNPDVVLSYCESFMVDESGEVLAANYLDYVADIDPLRWTADFQVSGHEEIALAMSIKNTIPNVSAVLFRTQALRTVLENYLEEMIALRNASDWLCYLRLLSSGGRLAFVAQSLNNHRRHQSGVTLSTMDRQHLTEIAGMQKLASELTNLPDISVIRAKSYFHKIAQQFGIDESSILIDA